MLSVQSEHLQSLEDMNKLLHRFRLLVAVLALLGCAGSEQAKPLPGSTGEPPAGLEAVAVADVKSPLPPRR